MIFVDLALAQIAAVGATYAATLGYDPASELAKGDPVSLAFTFVGAVAFALARMKKERVPQEAFIGIIYAAASALAILLTVKICNWRRRTQAHAGRRHPAGFEGNGSQCRHSLCRPWHLPFSVSQEIPGHFTRPEAAEAAGLNVRFWDILFYMSFGIVITKSVAIAGVLLVFSYLVVPAVIAQMWF